MPVDDVEVVREFYASVNSWLVAYWADPGLPVKETPELEDVLDRLDDEAEWDWLFSGETFRRVFVRMRVHAHGKGSGAPAEQTVFGVVTLRDGKVARIDDHTERAEGLEAAGL
jgi:hypothetical protein